MTPPTPKSKETLSAHMLFDILPIKDTCTWYGTKWKGTGKDAQLLPCGEPTVGAGLFCEPTHTNCEYHSVCERHKQPIQNWSDV